MHRQLSLGAAQIEIAAVRQRLNPPRRRMTTAARRTTSLRRSRGKANTAKASSYAPLIDALRQITAITHEMFPDGVQCAQVEDSEVAHDWYWRFRVVHNGSQAEALQKYKNWHARLGDFPADIRPLFRLSIDARQ